MERLDLGDNEITDISLLSGLTSLENLDLADNAIQTLPPLQNLTKLTSLDLDDNQIADVVGVKSGLSSLQTLNLRNNSGWRCRAANGFDEPEAVYLSQKAMRILL